MKSICNERKLYIPSKVNLTELILSKHSKRHLNDHQDKYAYVLSKIIELRIFSTPKRNGLVPLHAQTLQSIIGCKYRRIIEDLLEWEVIITDNHFIKHKESRGYDISLKYKSKGVEVMILKEQFAAKLQNHKFVTDSKPANYIKSKLKHIHIRYTEALQYIEEKYANTIALIDSLTSEDLYDSFKKAVNSHTVIDFYSISLKHESKYDRVLLNEPSYLKSVMETKYNSDLLSINHIQDRNYCFSVDKVTGRVYTFITNLSKSLRQFLYHVKFPDRPLVNVDIKNSQPFIFCSLLKSYYNGSLPLDVQEYIMLCSQGLLYNELMEKMNYKGDRKSFKQMLFATLFYCDNDVSDNSSKARYFRNRFPRVYEVIRYYKEDDSTLLPRLMQSNEAHLMIENVVKRLQRDRVFLSTIHDSVLVFADQADVVKDTIRKYFDKLYQIVPSLDVEHVTYQNNDKVIIAMAA